MIEIKKPIPNNVNICYFQTLKMMRQIARLSPRVLFSPQLYLQIRAFIPLVSPPTVWSVQHQAVSEETPPVSKSSSLIFSKPRVGLTFTRIPLTVKVSEISEMERKRAAFQPPIYFCLQMNRPKIKQLVLW